MILIDSLMGLSCKRFARHVSMGVEPLKGGLYAKLQFWVHWLVCPFCKRYWKEINEIALLQRSFSALQNHPALKMADFKKRLKEQMIRKAS